MNGKNQSSHHYLLGHSDEEIWRLQKQAELLHPATRRFLEDVGIKAGMTVLDVGTGVGENMTSHVSPIRCLLVPSTIKCTPGYEKPRVTLAWISKRG